MQKGGGLVLYFGCNSQDTDNIEARTVKMSINKTITKTVKVVDGCHSKTNTT